jgi:hypothetical protein
MSDPSPAVGAVILSALVRIRAGLIIAVVAFIQIAKSVSECSIADFRRANPGALEIAPVDYRASVAALGS